MSQPVLPTGSLGQVLPAAASALGAKIHTTDLAAIGHDGESAQAALGLEDAAVVCVALVDGLGWHQLLERGGHAPFLRPRTAGARTVESSFPATTATSMGLFGTGLWPGLTGLAGYAVRGPMTHGEAGVTPQGDAARSASAVNLLAWDTPIAPEAWQPHPTIFELAAAKHVDSVFVGEAKLQASGMTRAALRGATFVVAATPEDRAEAVGRLLREPGPRIIYVYFGELDRVGHRLGVGSLEWGDALTDVDSALARIARTLPRGGQLIVTADHGMIDVPQSARWDVAHEPELAHGVDLVAGEHRATHLYCAPGQAQAVAQRWADRLGDAVWVRTRSGAVAQGWFGPVEERVLPIIGDVVVQAASPVAVLDSRRQSASAMHLVGLHGSMSAAETQVPLIVISGEGSGRG